jgi:store-operated calcium entry-associated regulatory factor
MLRAATLTLLLAAGVFLFGRGASADGVLLSEVTALTFRDGRQTAAGRTSPLPQLRCVGCGTFERQFAPQSARCTNAGVDDTGRVQWTCEADLDQRVKFGVTTVSCEGYSRPGDPYILPGSCSLEYTLEKTGMHSSNAGGYQGENAGARYPSNNAPQSTYGTYRYDPRAGQKGSGLLSSLLVFAIFAVIIGGICHASNQRQQAYGGGGAAPRPPPYNPASGYAPGVDAEYPPYGGGAQYGGTRVHGGGMFGGFRPGMLSPWNWGMGTMLGAGLLGGLWNRGGHRPGYGYAPRGMNATHNTTGGGGGGGGTRNARAYATTETR